MTNDMRVWIVEMNDGDGGWAPLFSEPGCIVSTRQPAHAKAKQFRDDDRAHGGSGCRYRAARYVLRTDTKRDPWTCLVCKARRNNRPRCKDCGHNWQTGRSRRRRAMRRG